MDNFLNTIEFSKKYNKCSTNRIIEKRVGYDGLRYIDKNYYCPTEDNLQKFKSLLGTKDAYCTVYESHMGGSQTCYYIEK